MLPKTSNFNASSIYSFIIYEAVKDRYNNIIMNTRIRENIALAESAGSGMSIFEYDPQSNGAADYLALTEEILSRNL